MLAVLTCSRPCSPLRKPTADLSSALASLTLSRDAIFSQAEGNDDDRREELPSAELLAMMGLRPDPAVIVQLLQSARRTDVAAQLLPKLLHAYTAGEARSAADGDGPGSTR